MTYTRAELKTNLRALINEYDRYSGMVAITTLKAYYEGKRDAYKHALEMARFKVEA